MAASVEQTGQAFKGLAPHNHRAAFGNLLKMAQVRRNMPGHIAILANDPIFGAGNNKDDFGPIHERATSRQILSIQAGNMTHLSVRLDF